MANNEPNNHFDGKRFFNPNGTGQKGFDDLVRWMRTRSKTKWPSFIPNALPSRNISNYSGDGVAITFIGHSTFLLQMEGINILTDPVFSQRASPVSWAGPKRVRVPGIALENLPEIHLILVSHNHYDHLDLTSLRFLQKCSDPTVVTLLNNQSLLAKAGFQNITELDWWQSGGFKNFKITATPAQHFSARKFSDRNKALWGGLMIEGKTRTIYFAGDSGYGTHFVETGQRFSKIDLALLPIGAYEPRWFMKDLHMNPAEAVQAFLDLKAKQAIGMHFGTFQLTDEAVDEPVLELRRQQKIHGLEPMDFDVLDFGETRIF